MQNKQITVSANFKKMTAKAILSIIFFIAIYLVLLTLAIGLTIVCGYLGVQVIVLKPMIWTLLIGAGLISIGVLILIFLVKFIFKKHRADRSHLVEINEGEQPELFSFIHEIVDQVHTAFPKKVYLSADVNASVFYDSSFWSMFFPVKKNLQIGIGLVNTVTVSEFKAILAHEFGHFSQRSMKVGSYVYNVNQVIHNMLYDNDSYGSLFAKWSGISSILAFCVGIVIKIVQAIQWVLGKTYQVVNLNYMALSREMEFHADEVAAHVAGSQPLITSLLRLDLADYSYNTLLNYYGGKISESVKTRNLYPQHRIIMNFMATESKLPIENNLPAVPLDYLGKFNKSKLVIKDQWASHPATPERIEQLEKHNVPVVNENKEVALVLFRNMEALQEKFTTQIFSVVELENPTEWNDPGQFENQYRKDFRENSFEPVYQGYYDNKNPVAFNLEETAKEADELTVKSIEELFDQQAVDRVYEYLSMEGDIATLKQIDGGKTGVKTFDYEGVKFKAKQAGELISKLEKELEMLKEAIAVRDKDIFRYFCLQSRKQNREEEFLSKYRALFNLEKEYDIKSQAHNLMLNAAQFTQYTLAIEVIEKETAEMKKQEILFIEQVKELLQEPLYQPSMTKEMRENFEEFTTTKRIYFLEPQYREDDLKVLFSCLDNFLTVILATYFRVKKEMLSFQVELEKGNVQKN